MNDYFALQVHPILKFAPLELKNVCINIGRAESSPFHMQPRLPQLIVIVL